MNVAAIARHSASVLLLGAAVYGVLKSGEDLRAPPPLAPAWRVTLPGNCLGETIALTQSGVYLHATSGELTLRGKLEEEGVALTIACGKDHARLEGTWTPEALAARVAATACGCAGAIAAEPAP